MYFWHTSIRNRIQFATRFENIHRYFKNDVRNMNIKILGNCGKRIALLIWFGHYLHHIYLISAHVENGKGRTVKLSQSLVNYNHIKIDVI